MPNKYHLEWAKNGYKRVDVTSLEDILEFTYMAQIHEYLQERKPKRYILIQYARFMLNLEYMAQYSRAEQQELIKALLEKYYPWYDPQITEYQVGYEQDRTMDDGSEVKHISCRNDNRKFSRFCIGMDNCEYSLYQSVSIKPEVDPSVD